MNEEEKITAAQRIHEEARYMRGRFLNILAVIERDISFVLQQYFCTEDPNKQKLFLKHIVGAHGIT